MTGASIEYLVCDIDTVGRAREAHRWLDSLLSPAEISYSNRLRRGTDRDAYRCAHLLLRIMAARRLGLDPQAAGSLTFTRTCRSCGGPHRKPQIAGAELSLSKSDGMVAVASAPSSSPVGIDIERIPSAVFPGFDDYVLAPTESVPQGGDAVRRRLELWVYKEAAVKATGHGLSLAPLSRRPSHAAALSCADRLPVTSLRLSEVLTG